MATLSTTDRGPDCVGAFIQKDLDNDDDIAVETEHLMSTHWFNTTFQETPIFFHVTKFGDDKSVMIWIGGDDGTLNNLAFAAVTPYDRGLPSSTELFTASGDRTSTVMAAKLTKKLRKPVYISMNLPENIDGSLLHSVEMRLMEEIQKAPHNF